MDPKHVVIPWWDSGCPDRRRAKEYVTAYYTRHFPTTVFEAEPGMSRAAVRNAAVTASAHRTIALVDADVFIPSYQLAFALDWASRKRRLIKPYFVVGYMSKTATLEWTADPDPSDITPEQFRKLSVPWSGIHGGAFVMQRSAWLEVGFVGWGGEDNAFNEACAKKFGKIGLVKGYGFHLYHPRIEKMSDANRERLLTYTQRDKLLPPYFTRSPK